MMSPKTTTLTLIIVWCLVVPHCLALDHNVDWRIGTDYTRWASGQKFAVGDNLVFNYAGASHTVTVVSESDYKTCSTSNVYSSDNSGHTVIPLNTPGTRYFICGVPGHCQSGMKLAVTASQDQQPSLPPPPPPPPAAAVGTAPPQPDTNCTVPVTPSSPRQYLSSAAPPQLVAVSSVAAIFMTLLI